MSTCSLFIGNKVTDRADGDLSLSSSCPARQSKINSHCCIWEKDGVKWHYLRPLEDTTVISRAIAKHMSS